MADGSLDYRLSKELWVYDDRRSRFRCSKNGTMIGQGSDTPTTTDHEFDDDA